MSTLLSAILPLSILLYVGCSRDSSSQSKIEVETAVYAKGDSIALHLARQVELASGGRENWNAIRYLSFNFFDSRIWYWDKWEKRYRVESLRRGYRIAGTLDGKETNLFANGKVETNPDSLDQYAELAYKTWINDTYWFILPFKLLDSGVLLAYKGVIPVDSITSAKCIELTFEQVGVTPENKYHIFIDSTTHHIIHWAYFKSNNDSLPQLSNPWTDYKSYGNILLSSGRGDRAIKDIRILTKLSDRTFREISVPLSELVQ